MAFSSAREIFDRMPQGFRADKAVGADLVYQFHISDVEPGGWYVVIKDGTCAVVEGVHDAPTVALTMGEDDWVAMVSGKLNAAMAFMSGKITAKGDLFAAQKFGSFFKIG